MSDARHAFDDYAQEMAQLVYAAVRDLGVPGIGYVVIGNLGQGVIDMKFKFEDEGGQKVKGFMPMERSSEAMDLVVAWLQALDASTHRTWKVLLCGVSTDGNFSMTPIYADDPNINQWDFETDKQVNFISMAKDVLDL